MSVSTHLSIENRLLAALPASEYQRIAPYLEKVQLSRHQFLNHGGEEFSHVYFLNSDELPLTQEFISHMLGVRRSGVTIAAGTLQRAGMSRYSRGRITIVERKHLESTACECYGVVKDAFARLLATKND